MTNFNNIDPDEFKPAVSKADVKRAAKAAVVPIATKLVENEIYWSAIRNGKTSEQAEIASDRLYLIIFIAVAALVFFS